MFSLLYINRIKSKLRNKTLVFWTLLFPIILATMFNFAFGGFMENSAFKAVPVAIVDNNAYQENESFKSVMDAVSEDQDPIFDIHLVKDEAEGLRIMSDNTVSGVIQLTDNKPELIVGKSGLEQSIIKSVLDQYNQTTATASNIAASNPAAFTESFMEELTHPKEFISKGNLIDKSLNTLLISFYSLLGMACFYGSFLGLEDIIDIQANLSDLAARVALAPTHKFKVLLSNFCATMTIHFFDLMVLIAYLVFVLKVEMGAYIPQTMLITFAGSICGITFGMLIGILFKCSIGLKTGILVSFTMLLSFFSGMMSQDIKYMISENLPFLAALNPVNQITEAFYTLYYYGPGPRFYSCIVILLVFSAVFAIITYFFARRQQYASL